MLMLNILLNKYMNINILSLHIFYKGRKECVDYNKYHIYTLLLQLDHHNNYNMELNKQS